jgi:predicted alpha/beta hydrolase family esterase
MAPTRRIRAALLVAPADLENPLPAGYPELDDLRAGGWLPIPRQPLPFPTLVVASSNDPLAGFDRTVEFAGAWGARICDAGEVGHLNPAAGYGPWPRVNELLAELHCFVL